MSIWLKIILSLLLLPLCVGSGKAAWLLIGRAHGTEVFWVGCGAGAMCWWVIYLLLPKPMWIYVFGHELTHAIWTWLFLGKVKKFKVTHKGGHVIVTKANFLTTLAPYFFPIYVFLVVSIFWVGHLIWNWSRFYFVFYFFVGAAYAFHLTLTWFVLRTRQTDILQYGWLFAGIIIWLGNILIFIIGLSLMTKEPGFFMAMGWIWLETGHFIQRLGSLIGR